MDDMMGMLGMLDQAAPVKQYSKIDDESGACLLREYM
jgi:hypothetical protein